jgi:hypothetical protein
MYLQNVHRMFIIKKIQIVMVTNINKTKNHLSLLTEHKKTTTYDVVINVRAWNRHTHAAGLNQL